MTRAMGHQPVYIYGDGEQRRSFTYIDDCAPLIAEAGLMEETSGEIINIGADDDCSVNQLVNAIEEAIGEPIVREYVSDRPQEVKMAWCDHRKATNIFRIKRTTPLGEGLRTMVDWVKETGLKPMRYLETLEIESPKAPVTWTKKLI
jgi:nucleoside-diphosphate-sugar epimerase